MPQKEENMKPSYAPLVILAILMSSLLGFGVSPEFDYTVKKFAGDPIVSPEFDYTVKKFAGNPIISTQTFIDAGLPLTDQASNINGPCLIRVPDWVSADERPNPAARYYLYFAHHNGKSIRMAWSEQVTGPYTLYNGYEGVLSLQESSGENPSIYLSDNFRIRGHIASPDVIVDEENKRFIMYFHSYVNNRENSNSDWVSHGQNTVAITSTDALNFNNKNYIDAIISSPYLRYFTWNGHHYGHQHNRIWYAPDGNPQSAFKAGMGISSNVRHSAVVVKGNKLGIWYSKHSDIPERIKFSEWKIGSFPQTNWQLTDGPIEVIRPEFDWEGVNYPIQAGTTGSGTGLHQLRDPGYFQDIDGKEYLLYTGSGEEAIGIAFLSLRRPDSNNN